MVQQVEEIFNNKNFEDINILYYYHVSNKYLIEKLHIERLWFNQKSDEIK